MAFNFKDNKAFTDILKQKQADIQRRTSAGILESDNFKQLHSSLTTFLQKNSFRDFKTILITKEELEFLPEYYYEKLEQSINSDLGVSNNIICIDRELNIILRERNFNIISNSNDVRILLRDLSKEFLVFHLQPEARLSIFIDGDDYVEGLFLTPDDWNAYMAKKTVDELPSLLESYRIHLRTRSTYNKFFIAKSHLKSLYRDLKSQLTENRFEEQYKHLLQNKPEDRFREDLRHFLSNHLRAKLHTKEYILEDFKRLDIMIIDESGYNLYFIEVKWVGECVNAEGKKISSTAYDSKDINPAAIIQSVKYIKQLDLEGKNIKRGYLVVFDARKDQTQKDTVESFDEFSLEEEYKIHYKKFKKIDDFKVVNTHPS